MAKNQKYAKILDMLAEGYSQDIITKELECSFSTIASLKKSFKESPLKYIEIMNCRWKFSKSNDPRIELFDLKRRGMGNYTIGQADKETGQNALDVWNDRSKPIKLFIDLIHISAEKKNHFLETLGIETETIIHKMKLMKDFDKRAASKLEKMVKLLKSNNDFYTLRIIDQNTYGLDGRIYDKNSNIYGYYKLVGISNKSGTQGGSYGEGRLIIILSSKIQMVVSISHLSKDKIWRKYGTVFLSPFDENTSEYSGIAYYGVGDPTNAKMIPKDYSKFDSDDLLFPHDLNNNEFGNAFYFPFFDFSEEIENANLEYDNLKKQWIIKTSSEITKWLFPAIHNNKLNIILRTFEYPNIQDISDGNVELEINHTNLFKIFKLFSDENTMEFDIDLIIPGKRRGEKVKESQKLKLLKIEPDNIILHDLEINGMLNKIILGRNDMVIKYHELKDFIPNSDFVGFMMIKGENSVKFLKSCEPPRHDDWKIQDRLKDDYGKVKGPSALKDFYKEIRKIVSENFGFLDNNNGNSEEINRYLMGLLPVDFEYSKIDPKKPKKLTAKTVKSSPVITFGPEKPKIIPKPKKVSEKEEKTPQVKKSIPKFKVIKYIDEEKRLKRITAIPIKIITNRSANTLGKLKQIKGEINFSHFKGKIPIKFTHIIIEVYTNKDIDLWEKLPILLNKQHLKYGIFEIVDNLPSKQEVIIDLSSIPQVLRRGIPLYPYCFGINLVGEE